jgi:predicted MPP superfamily phosphohydrolase
MLLIIFLIAIFAFFVYAFFVEPNMLDVTKISLSFDKLPVSADGIKIVQISDFHYNRDALIYEKTLRKIAELKPDIIVITGDFTGSRGNDAAVSYCKRIVSLGKPAFAVMGNWDHKTVAAYTLKNSLTKAGVRVLTNENVEFMPHFHIAGTDDSYTGFADLQKTFSGIPEGDFVLLLTHAPDIIYDAAQYKPDLVLCGHTHGGQVKIPFIKKALYVPSIYGSRFLEGLFRVNGVYMYVNRGIGESHLRMRFLSKPEITVFTLHKK